MVEDRGHKALLQFVKKVVDVPAVHSKEDLTKFRSAASHAYPLLVPVIDAYLHLAEQSDSGVSLDGSKRTVLVQAKHSPENMHLFDLLRDQRLFPSNSDLSEFAGRILPGVSRTRFQKISRPEIAARIIDYVDGREPHTREQLEISMRDAISGTVKPAERQSFVAKWEKIIKGIEL